MKYLIIGHPRCGTGFMSKLFLKNNLEVGHEKMGANGTSDWQYAIQDSKCFPWTSGVRINYQFDKIIHNVRDPFTAIPSIAFTETPGFGEQSWRTVSEQFRRYKISFTPYDLRHAWAVRTILIGLPNTVAAKMMGHSVSIHTKTYHHWITRRDQQQAVDSALSMHNT